MSTDTLNTIVLATVLVLVMGGGVFITQQKQPEQLERLEQEETALRLRQAEISELLVEEAESSERAAEALRRWNSRYKVLPEHLTSPAVVHYLNALTRHGFSSFDVSLVGVSRSTDFSTLSYNIRGRGYFGALYRFVWNVENGRGLYRVRSLDLKAAVEEDSNTETGIPRRRDVVDFSMTLDAYFGGADGMSAPDSFVTVPDYVLPAKTPVADPFYPLIFASLPPNTDNLVDVENDSLVSVIGQVAVFRDDLGARPVREGDRVYLGTITRVDPNEAHVVADLNKGGLRERVEIRLATGERYRQAIGTPRLSPLNMFDDSPAPPAPGTPEARRAERAEAAARGEDAGAVPVTSTARSYPRTPAPSRLFHEDAAPEGADAHRP